MHNQNSLKIKSSSFNPNYLHYASYLWQIFLVLEAVTIVFHLRGVINLKSTTVSMIGSLLEENAFCAASCPRFNQASNQSIPLRQFS